MPLYLVNVLSVHANHHQVVLADSSIVNANAHENPDLFWALKGGGSNLGEFPSTATRRRPNGIQES